ncbi:aromatic ring-hydroxylating dioxygenase subunit alpha [Mycobacterium avium]|uniref:aromatic ring-hydroxylating dioxygenase subunit alpha n=1 Tax=Mycobacterium avium TaxID=1764 RepID=UPI001CC587D7|nr:aromatic ring-hydroxylating dioxygenase subunit alpha [Mycobacterium avium]MBZ4521806.1 oxygenase [Mycobacterium avium subsp. hominissuis]MBZ4531182.1 oxygenase [Mycobacterium avium subsp. hominissuis]
MAQALESLTTAPKTFRPGTFTLRDAWFPLEFTSQIRRRPVRRVLHGEPVFFYRDRAGNVKAADTPPGTPASQRPGSPLTDRTGHYPLIERYGYAWVWYGNPDNASPDVMPNIPHTPVEGMPRRFQSTVVYDCTYELVCENLLDLTHADFLHSKLTGDALSEHDVIEVESTSETVTMTRIAHGRPVPQAQKAWARGAKTQNVRAVTITYVRSGLCVLHGDFNPGMSVPMIHPTNPESPTRCRALATFNPRYMPTWGRALFPLSAHPVGRQDNWALRKQNANYVNPAQADAPTGDLSSRFDKAGLRYRKVYQQLVARQREGDFSYLADAGIARDTSEELGINIRA